MHKIKVGDTVKVITGKYKNKLGKVIKVLTKPVAGRPQMCFYYVVEGINVVTRHTKPNPNQGREGGLISKEMPIHGSNVMLANAAGHAARVGIKTLEDGRKVRYFKGTGEVIDV